MSDQIFTIANLGILPQPVKKILNRRNLKSKQIETIKELNEFLLVNTIDICFLNENDIDETEKKLLIEINSNTTFILMSEEITHTLENRVFYINSRLLSKKKLLDLLLGNIFRLIINFKNRDDFSAMLLHDTRSPVNSIIGYLELLESGVFGELNEGQKQIINNTISLGDMLVDFIEEFNYIRQFENRDLQIKKVTFDIIDVLNNVLLSSWVQADKKDIKIHKNITGNLPSLIGDSGKIQRVIMNLIQNAIKFAPEKSEICIEIKNSGENCIQFSVSDKGPGIKEKDLKYVFDKYFSVKQKQKGEKNFGLGLYIAKSIINAHGGKIWVENNQDCGAAFHFILNSKPEIKEECNTDL